MSSQDTSDSHHSSFDMAENDNIIKKQNKKIITIGICSRLYLYILYSGLFKLLSLVLLGDNKIFEDGIGLFGFCPILYKFNFMQSIYIYIGYIIFGLFFFILKELIIIRKEYILMNLMIY